MNNHMIDWYRIQQVLSLKYWWSVFWWRFVPGIEIKVHWPVGDIAVDHNDPRWYDVGADRVQVWSVYPEDHYGPFMREWIGKKGWDWDWESIDEMSNYLIIRIRKKHATYASHIAMMWA
jgi:hypothetical protein